MLRHSRSSWMSRSVAGLVVALTAVGLHADDRVGVVRIRDGKAPVIRAQSVELPVPVAPAAASEIVPEVPAVEQTAGEVQPASADCEVAQPAQPCQAAPAPCQVCTEEPGLCWKIKAAAIIHHEKAKIRAYDAGQAMAAHRAQRRGCGNPNCPECRGGAGCQDNWLWRKLGYFRCTGSCGQGTPLVGHYSMVYPVNPGYFDPRDGQVYSSQVFNTPVSVPLAPVVNHTYNYGWGVPSSRLTPVSHPVPYAPY